MTGIDTDTWHELAENRTDWRQAVKKGVRSFEAERLKARAHKRQKRKAKEAQHIGVQQIPVSADFVCQTRGRACKSRIGFYSHSRTHNNNDIIETDESTTTSIYVLFCFW